MGILSGMTERRSIENPSIPLSSAEAFNAVFGVVSASASGVNVTVDNALGVTAVWAAVNFISSTIATLPLELFNRTADGRDRVPLGDSTHRILRHVANEDMVTSYKWRRMSMNCALTEGRAFTYIERNQAQRVANLWPLDPSDVEVVKRDVGGIMRTFYETRAARRKVVYNADEIIDIPFYLEKDGITHRSPIMTCKNAIGLALAQEEYSSRFFRGGGVPPLALQGPPTSADAIKRATAAIDDAIRRAQQENKNVLYMPMGHELKPIAFNPEEGQLTDSRLNQLLEVARIYGLPPVFLQDLSHGTFSNTEQQDLWLVKHTLTNWLKLWEQEINAKLFPRNSNRFAKFNVDGLLRGDFKTRMEGYQQGVNSGVITPDEARELENRPAKGGKAGDLFINSAAVPISGVDSDPAEQPEDNDDADDEE